MQISSHQPAVSRRQMLTKSAVAAGIAAGIQSAPFYAQAAGSQTRLSKGDVILFQGDSITDARRNRKTATRANDPSALGDGYPGLIAAELLRDHPKSELKFFNRGISGNKVPDLQKRWQADCIDFKPALLSILIGVNDIWHKLNGRYAGSVADYRKGFAALLTQTKEALPGTTIVICEPFVLKCGAVNEKWFPEFDQRRAAAKQVAHEANTIWVPFQSMFDEAVAAGTKPEYWARDGVHPSLAGHALMAATWQKIVNI